VAVIGLGVRDFARARAFYSEGLGWPIQQEEGEWVSFLLNGGSLAVSLFGWEEKAADAGVSPEGSGFRGISLSYNVRSEERVDEVLAEAERAGATIVRPSEHTFWGGYSGYFSDPDGHLWEVQTGATRLPFSE
jgi:catechol 2,3-dioxygenase-like lactoylglutathione lyase family enzyme